MQSQVIVNWLLVLAPLIAGSVIYFSKSESAVGRMDRLDAWLVARYESACGKDGRFNAFVMRPALWMLTLVMSKTESISDAFLRSGIRIAAYGYVTAFVIYLLFVAVAVVLAVAMMILAFWIFAAFTGEPSGRTVIVRSRERKSFFGDTYIEHENAAGEVIGESRERVGLLGGKYTEHENAAGEVVGESREREGLLGGTYTEHQNAAGVVTGESREREGLLGGTYTEHQNAAGVVTGESREREGLLGGTYTEHQNAAGVVTGESREREGLLGGKYTESTIDKN